MKFKVGDVVRYNELGTNKSGYGIVKQVMVYAKGKETYKLFFLGKDWMCYCLKSELKKVI